MSNPRVYELAKELGVPSKDLLSRLTSMGVEAKSHASTISPDVADKLRSAIRGGGRQRPAAGGRGDGATQAAGRQPQTRAEDGRQAQARAGRPGQQGPGQPGQTRAQQPRPGAGQARPG
ncbi:MAG TPA: translation initiation factor IF-2 N-terminal domain-containing protein, partial [Actinomycetes bacterium]|nr:translation initiation factor IF-2 N-terminal domain-containing protein [Actinomycetes bacterium]